MNFFQIILIISLVLLLLTKLADVWTTVRHVGRQGESNPLARALFAKVGFAGGMAVVMVLWAVIVGVVYISAWSLDWVRWTSSPCTMAPVKVPPMLRTVEPLAVLIMRTVLFSSFAAYAMPLYCQHQGQSQTTCRNIVS